MKSLYYTIVLILMVNSANAKYPEKYIYDSIKNDKVFRCFNSDSPEVKIAFDRYRDRLYHYPFINYNHVKLIKSERLDDTFPLFEHTYIELLKNKKIATFTIMTQGNDVWGATYESGKGKAVPLDIASYDLTKIQALYSNDLNNSE